MKTVKFERLMIVIGLIMIASISYNFGLAVLFMNGTTMGPNAYLYTIALSMPIGFILLPYLITKKKSLLSGAVETSFNIKSMFFLAVTLFLADLLFFKTGESFNQLIIATSEEFLFRYLVYNILRHSMTKWQSIVINSLLFALVLHLNYDVVDNLLLRFPLALLFSYLSQRFGLQYAIASHWLYNLTVIKFGF